MADEIKPPAGQSTQPAPTGQKPPDAPQSTQPADDKGTKPGTSGLDSFTTEQLKDFYARSPQMFKDAGIVKEEVKPKEEPPVKKVDPPAPPPESAAPKYGDVEIQLPTDVPIDRKVVDEYLAHAKENGLNAKQVQAEIDFNVKKARVALASQPKQPTLEEVDAANVAKLKADPEFGKNYEANKEVALRAAAKFGDKDVLNRLTTSDPVLIKHFWKLGQADAEDTTVRGAPRSGSEGEPEADRDAYLQKRYNNSPTMFKQPVKG